MDIVAPPEDRVGEGSENLGWGRRDKNVFHVRDATFGSRKGPMIQVAERQDN
jgi:hypothetical protein